MKQANDNGKCKVNARGQATIQGCCKAEAVHNAVLGPETCTGGKPCSKRKVARQSKSSNPGNVFLNTVIIC